MPETKPSPDVIQPVYIEKNDPEVISTIENIAGKLKEPNYAQIFLLLIPKMSHPFIPSIQSKLEKLPEDSFLIQQLNDMVIKQENKETSFTAAIFLARYYFKNKNFEKSFTCFLQAQDISKEKIKGFSVIDLLLAEMILKPDSQFFDLFKSLLNTDTSLLKQLTYQQLLVFPPDHFIIQNFVTMQLNNEEDSFTLAFLLGQYFLYKTEPDKNKATAFFLKADTIRAENNIVVSDNLEQFFLALKKPDSIEEKEVYPHTPLLDSMKPTLKLIPLFKAADSGSPEALEYIKLLKKDKEKNLLDMGLLARSLVINYNSISLLLEMPDNASFIKGCSLLYSGNKDDIPKAITYFESVNPNYKSILKLALYYAALNDESNRKTFIDKIIKLYAGAEEKELKNVNSFELFLKILELATYSQKIALMEVFCEGFFRKKDIDIIKFNHIIQDDPILDFYRQKIINKTFGQSNTLPLSSNDLCFLKALVDGKEPNNNCIKNGIEQLQKDKSLILSTKKIIQNHKELCNKTTLFNVYFAIGQYYILNESSVDQLEQKKETVQQAKEWFSEALKLDPANPKANFIKAFQDYLEPNKEEKPKLTLVSDIEKNIQFANRIRKDLAIYKTLVGNESQFLINILSNTTSHNLDFRIMVDLHDAIRNVQTDPIELKEAYKNLFGIETVVDRQLAIAYFKKCLNNANNAIMFNVQLHTLILVACYLQMLEPLSEEDKIAWTDTSMEHYKSLLKLNCLSTSNIELIVKLFSVSPTFEQKLLFLQLLSNVNLKTIQNAINLNRSLLENETSNDPILSFYVTKILFKAELISHAEMNEAAIKCFEAMKNTVSRNLFNHHLNKNNQILLDLLETLNRDPNKQALLLEIYDLATQLALKEKNLDVIKDLNKKLKYFNDTYLIVEGTSTKKQCIKLLEYQKAILSFFKDDLKPLSAFDDLISIKTLAESHAKIKWWSQGRNVRRALYFYTKFLLLTSKEVTDESILQERKKALEFIKKYSVCTPYNLEAHKILANWYLNLIDSCKNPVADPNAFILREIEKPYTSQVIKNNVPDSIKMALGCDDQWLKDKASQYLTQKSFFNVQSTTITEVIPSAPALNLEREQPLSNLSSNVAINLDNMNPNLNKTPISCSSLNFEKQIGQTVSHLSENLNPASKTVIPSYLFYHSEVIKEEKEPGSPENEQVVEQDGIIPSSSGQIDYAGPDDLFDHASTPEPISTSPLVKLSVVSKKDNKVVSNKTHSKKMVLA